jgi:hypothetical protein
MALVNQGGSLLLRNGALATGQACCCGPQACDCNSGFSFYANGALLVPGGGVPTTSSYKEWIPGISPYTFFDFKTFFDAPPTSGLFTYGTYGWAQGAECDENGDLVVRVNIYCSAQDMEDVTQAEIVESRFYKFELSAPGAGALLTGSPIAPPEGAEADFLFYGSPGVIEGQTIVYLSSGSPDDGRFRMDWSSVTVQASCVTNCGGGEYINDCGDCGEGCACVELQYSVNFSDDPFSFTLNTCRLNPLP